MKPDDKDDNTVAADIPESVFEEALRSIERIQKEARSTSTKSAPAAPKKPSAAPSPPPEESGVNSLDELMELLSGPPKKAAPKKQSKQRTDQDADLNTLSQMLEDEYDLEKESDYFKSVMNERAEAPVADKSGVDPALLEEKETKIQELMEHQAKIRAEFENFRKRLSKEAESTKRFSNESLILQLLPILDNLERAIEHADATADKKAMVQGVRLIYKQFLDSLENAGLRQIEAKGRPFDPTFHDAITTVETNEVSPNLVISEYQRGYMLHERLIRPTRVVVSMTPQGDNGDGNRTGQDKARPETYGTEDQQDNQTSDNMNGES